jgi:RimJ/RimL family protein N-acetyltransferase
VADPELGRLLGFENDPLAADVRDMAAGVAEAAASGRSAALTVITTPDDTFAGELFVHDISWEHRRCDIGLFLTPAARRRGLAQAAVARLLTWVFEDLGMERAEMTTTTQNARLRAFAARLGFAEEGVLRAHNIERGRRVDLAVFGLLREEWRSRPA